MSGPAPVNQIDNISTITPAGGPVGKPFDGGNPDSWPGVEGNVSKNGNFYPYNSDKVVDPPVSTPNELQSGGKKRRTRKRHHKKAKKAKKSRRGRKSMSKRRKSKGKKQNSKRKHIGKRKSRGKMRGGSTRSYVGQPIRNIFRNAKFGAGELVNNWNGRPTPISYDPNPSSQPIGSSIIESKSSYVDLNALGKSADNTVSNM